MARRRAGRDGWVKRPCGYSRTGFAWWRADDAPPLPGQPAGACTCVPCVAPRTTEVQRAA